MDSILSTIGDLTVYLSIIIGLLYLLGIRRNSKAYKVFAGYLLLIALVQAGAYYVGRGYLSKPNLYYSHFYYVGQFVVLTMFFATLLRKKWPYYILIPVIVYVAYGFIDDPQSIYRFNTIGMTITHAVLVIYSVLYLYKSISEKGEFVIVSSGIFFYLLSSTLIFASQNLIVDMDMFSETRNVLMDLNVILYMAFLILILIEWIKNYNVFKGLVSNGSNRG